MNYFSSSYCIRNLKIIYIIYQIVLEHKNLNYLKLNFPLLHISLKTLDTLYVIFQKSILQCYQHQYLDL